VLHCIRDTRNQLSETQRYVIKYDRGAMA